MRRASDHGTRVTAPESSSRMRWPISSAQAASASSSTAPSRLSNSKVFVAPTDCILSNVTVVQPDVFYIAADRLAIISERGIEGAPTLVVEVLSPSTAHLDRGRKMKLYAEHGVLYYWIVDPESCSIEAYALAGAAYALAGRVTSEPVALPPFSDLTVDPALVWS